MIDLHQHVIYGVDDGPRTVEASIRMLEMARDEGVRAIFATSHATPSLEPFPAETYVRRIRRLNQMSYERGLGVTLYPGCEVFWSDVALRKLCEGRLPTLGGTRFALIEFDPTDSLPRITDALRQAANAGLIPVLAHCERYPALLKRPEALLQLRRQLRMRLQLNTATVTGRCPRPMRRLRDALLKADLLDYLATDAHDVGARAPRMREARAWIAARYGEERAERLTAGNQRELLPGI